MNEIQERQLKSLNIPRQPKKESASIHTARVSANDIGQGAKEHVIPESPELSLSDDHLSELRKGEAGTAAAHSFTTSSEQSLFLYDDDESFRPAPSELDPLEFVRGDTEFDAAALFELAPTFDTTSERFTSPSHAPPSKYASTKGGVEPRSRVPTSKGNTQKRKRKVEADSNDEQRRDRTLIETENPSNEVSSDEDSLPSARSLLLSSAKLAREKHISTETKVNCDVQTPESLKNATKTMKRRKVVGAPDTDPSAITRYSGTFDRTPVKGWVADSAPKSTASLGESQHAELELPDEEVRSQTFVPVPSDSADNARCVDINISTAFKDRADLSSRIAGIPSAETDPRPQASILYWLLVSNQPRKRWQNRTDISLCDANVRSFFAAVTGPAEPTTCSSIDVTLRTSEEEWTFCLSRVDEDHFEDMKGFVFHKARSSRQRLNNASEVVEMYRSVREGTNI